MCIFSPFNALFSASICQNVFPGRRWRQRARLVLIHHTDTEVNCRRKEVFCLTTHSTHFITVIWCRKEGNVLFNDAFNTFYLRLYGVGRKEMFYLTTYSTHFIYGYMASDIWLRTILIVRKETRCRHIGYSFRVTARVLLYAPSHRQDSTYHILCYTSRGPLAGMRNTE